MEKDFVKPELTIDNLDNFYIRNSIFKSLKQHLNSFSGKMIDVGCGRMPYKDFILKNSEVKSYLGLDLENAITYDHTTKPDLVWNGKKIPVESDSFDCAMATEVLEHCPEPEIVLKEIYRILRPGGIVFITVPFLWNLHEVPHDEYRYTPFSLQRHIKNTGFKNIHMRSTGGWHASMAQMLGLWVKRSPMGNHKRKILEICSKPIIKYLIRKDGVIDTSFQDGQMITGLNAIAYK